MKAEFTTFDGKEVSLYPSSIATRNCVWLKIKDDYAGEHQATNLSKWDCAILIKMLEKALKSLEEEQ